jgi:hypothetical protein
MELGGCSIWFFDLFFYFFIIECKVSELVFFFSFPILSCCSKSDNQPQEDLAKSGYKANS